MSQIPGIPGLSPPEPPQPPVPGLPSRGRLPVGVVVPFAGSLMVPPQGGGSTFKTDVERLGWMMCDGRELNRIKFPELFAVLGYLYGGGGNTFKVPDYRGYFLRGTDGGSNNDPDVTDRMPAGGQGAESGGVGSVQDHALQTHEHKYKAVVAPATPSPQGQAAGAPSVTPAWTEGGPTAAPTAAGLPEPKVSQNETRPKNIYVNYIIKFKY